MIFAGSSDKGKVRDLNEDSYLVEPPLFAVADGMGGHRDGEVASKIAVDTLSLFKQELSGAENILGSLKVAFKQMNDKILRESEKNLESLGMGTTLSCVYLKNNEAFVGHIGDSRIYLIHNNSIDQITKDHSLVAEMVAAGQLTPEEAEAHPQRNIITRALGVKNSSNGDFFKIILRPDDKLLFASDGLFTMVKENNILSIVADQSLSLKEKVKKLVDEANDSGGSDNITVVLVDPFKDKKLIEDSIAKTKKTPALRSFIDIMALVIVVIILLLELASNNFYVSLKDNSVVLRQGFNRKIFNLPLSRQIQKKQVDYKEIPEWYRKRLKNGIAVSSLSEGKKTLEYIQSFSQ
jgi:protein phosphatase